jgi:putative endonuclease
MFTVYVIQNQQGQLYKGITEDIEQRLRYHNQDLGHWTKGKGPWRLVYSEQIENKTEALKREKFLKSGKGREVLKKLKVSDGL